MQTLTSGLGIRKPSPSSEHFICNLSYENNESLTDHVFWDFPGDTVAKTSNEVFQCSGCGFDPWWGSSDPTCFTAAKKTKDKTEAIL